MTAPDRQVAVTATWVTTLRNPCATEQSVGEWWQVDAVGVLNLLPAKERNPVQVTVRPATDTPAGQPVLDAEAWVGNELDHDRIPTAAGYAEYVAARPDPAAARPVDEHGATLIRECLRRLHEADRALYAKWTETPLTVDGETVPGWAVLAYALHMRQGALVLATLANAFTQVDPSDTEWVAALAGVEVLTPVPADELDDPDEPVPVTAAERDRITAAIKDHPRRDVVEAIAHALYSHASDDDDAIWAYMLEALELVTLLPALRLAHHETGGAAGGPGASWVACACGTRFDGFDTSVEARAALDQHIADATEAGAR